MCCKQHTINRNERSYKMRKTNMANKPIWGMTHVYSVYVLWARETAQSYETVLGEFTTLEQVKAFAKHHHQAHKWASYKIGQI